MFQKPLEEWAAAQGALGQGMGGRGPGAAGPWGREQGMGVLGVGAVGRGKSHVATSSPRLFKLCSKPVQTSSPTHPPAASSVSDPCTSLLGAPRSLPTLMEKGEAGRPHRRGSSSSWKVAGGGDRLGPHPGVHLPLNASATTEARRCYPHEP